MLHTVSNYFYNFAFDFKELGLCQTWLLFFDLNIWASGCYCLDSITRNWPVLLDQKGKDSLEEQVELNLFTKKKQVELICTRNRSISFSPNRLITILYKGTKSLLLSLQKNWFSELFSIIIIIRNSVTVYNCYLILFNI